MSRTLTITLPDDVYERITRAAAAADRSVERVLVESALAVDPAAAPAMTAIQPDLVQMAYLSDAALWQAARSQMDAAQKERLALLHDEQDRRDLSPSELEEEAALVQRYLDMVLVRAHAVLLLQHRGYDTGELFAQPASA